MGPRRDPHHAQAKRQERQIRQHEKKSREKSTYLQKDENTAGFEEQLRAFNLQLRDIPGDGNCLFRSFADQLDGTQERHRFYREQICQFIRDHREDFQPFIIDQPFDAFLKSLAKDGTYGGNECLVAFSRLYDARICIHQLNQPVWTVCFSDRPKHEIHISYHNYEHYSSVRRIGDHTADSANVRPAMSTCDPSSLSKSSSQKSNASTTTKKKKDYHEELFTEEDIDYIESQLVTPLDRQLIRDTLTDHCGDIDGTIVALLALDIPSTPLPDTATTTDQPLEKIMAVTGIDDVELVEQSWFANDQNLELTIQALLCLKTEDAKEEKNDEEWTDVKSKTKQRPVSNRQTKTEKKKAKKQRATEKHRAKVVAESEKSSSSVAPTVVNPNPNPNPEQPTDPPLAPPAQMEFIQI